MMAGLFWIYLAAGISIALIILGAMALSITINDLSSGTRMVTISGKVACLPHKTNLFSGAVTGECRPGFLESHNGYHYYYGVAIQNKEDYWLLSTGGSKELFNITGTIIIPPPTNSADGNGYDRYDIVGIIDIISVTPSDGSTSIYEVRYRHNRQISTILDEIYSATGIGYSWGVANCDGGEPCIRITLDAEAIPSKLMQKIPWQIEGFKVDVRVK